MTTPPPGSQPEPSDRPEPGHPAQSYPAPDQPAGLAGYQNYPGGADPYARYGDHFAEGPGAGAPDGDPLVPRDFGGWFQRIIGVIKRSFPRLAALAAITALVSAVFGVVVAEMVPSPGASGAGFPFDTSAGPTPEQMGMAAGSTGGFLTATLVGGLISLVVSAFVQGASIFVAVRDAAGRPAGVAEGLRFAAGRALPLIGWGLLGGIMVGVGFVLVILPAIYLGVVLATLPAVVVIERKNIGRCFELIKNRWWATFGRLLVVAIIGVIYYVLAILVAHAIGSGPTSAVAAIVQAILIIPLTVAATAVIVVTYAELRSHQPDGVSTSTLAAQLER